MVRCNVCNKHIGLFTKKKLCKRCTTEIELSKLVQEQNRFKGYCSLCHKTIPESVDRFFCKYCKRWHCSKHRLPETHNCKGNPEQLKKEYIESFSKGKTKIIVK